jgi:2C-methyl-D-erythritol 2,4-cyclodiphosphate synthase
MQQSFPVTGPAELEVRLASGEIEVDAVEGAESIDVELIAHDDESQQLVDNARLELRERHGRQSVLVEVPQTRGGFTLGSLLGRSGITCRVRVPQGSGLDARSKSADVSVHGTLGGVNVATASGDVVLEYVDGGVNVKSASGDVRMRTVTSGLNVQTASGDIEIEVARGPVNAQSASGDLVIGEAWDNVNASTVSGDQEHEAVYRGNFAATSVSGDVQVGVRRGSRVYLDCNSVSGDTSSELDMLPEAPVGDGPLVELRVKTVSGDITITRAPAPADTQEVHA